MTRMSIADVVDLLDMARQGWTLRFAPDDGDVVILVACPPGENPDMDGWYVGKGDTAADAVASLMDGLAVCGFTVARSTVPRAGGRITTVEAAEGAGQFIVDHPAMTALSGGES